MANISCLSDLCFDSFDVPMGAFWDCIGDDAPNSYEYSSLLYTYFTHK